MHPTEKLSQSNVPNFLVESLQPSYVGSGIIMEANRNQQTYNAIHQAITRWDQSALDRSHPGFLDERRRSVSRALRVYSGCLFIQPRADKEEEDYGHTGFVQRFWGYLLYQVSAHHGFANIESIGVNPDCRRQGFACRLVTRFSFNVGNHHSLLCSLVPGHALEFCNLLKKRNCRCDPEDGYFSFAWKAY